MVRLQLFVLAYNLGNFLRQGSAASIGASLDADDAAEKLTVPALEGRALSSEDRLSDGRGRRCRGSVLNHILTAIDRLRPPIPASG